jgi:hypothetical protein
MRPEQRRDPRHLPNPEERKKTTEPLKQRPESRPVAKEHGKSNDARTRVQ